MINRLELSKHRIEALSDGVFAIVMTLLVLELKIPELHKGAETSEIVEALRRMGPVFFSFLITFCLSALFWFLHSATFHYVRAVNRKVGVLSMGFLMFVSLLPFSAAMLGHFIADHLVQSMYYANQFAIGLFLFLYWRSAVSSGLLVDGAAAADVRGLSIRLAGVPVAALAAAIVAQFKPTMSGLAFMFVFIIFRLKSR